MQYETTQSKREVAKWDFSETFDKIFELGKKKKKLTYNVEI